MDKRWSVVQLVFPAPFRSSYGEFMGEEVDAVAQMSVMDEETVREVADMVWKRSRVVRHGLHRRLGEAGCRGRGGFGSSADTAWRESCDSAGCLDLLDEILTRVIAARERCPGPLAQGYFHRVIEREIAEHGRRLRVEAGGPAKPTRSDGVPGRVIAALDALDADAQAQQWRRSLFRMMRAYPHRLEPRGTDWPYDGWTAEKSKVDGRFRSVGAISSHEEILADIRLVLEVATRVAGPRWVAETVVLPLMQGGGHCEVSEVPDVREPWDQVLLRLLARRFRDLSASGTPRPEALRRACLEVYGEPPCEVSMEATELLLMCRDA